MEEILNNYFKFLDIFFGVAWIWLPVILAVIFFESWLYYIYRWHWRQLDWILLEVRPPKEMESSPKNMEQIFAGLWGVIGTVGYKYEKYIKGVMQDYFSFELVGYNGEAHFYLRILKKFRNLVEAQVYSQYPQAEIREVPDYVWNVPADIPNKNWNLWGCRLTMIRDSAYPIRTYVELMDVAKTDQPFFDPLSGLMEVFGKLRQGEQIWLQILFRPVPDDWQKKARAVADKLLGKKETPPPESLFAMDRRTWFESIYDALYAIITGNPAPLRATDKKDEKYSGALHLSPGEKAIIEGIELKSSKKGFDAKINFVYIGRANIFTMANVSAPLGVIMQIANLNMNSFRPDPKLTTKANYFFAKARKAYKQRVLMRMMRARSFWEKGYILNIEELATLFHFPTIGVKGPMTPYIEVKKGSAPVDLPME
ncbi:hypothetical protein KJ866_03560 [Patescibacteria group bacterium]|nr:hypothetical protein [Patescibacteria group bacterium]MBU2219916.1 hypothetical protein [Patescibacteria group bacterium]MBU2264608.1 hypothetical protein [Patescibacteria group bacterium]